MDRRGAHRGVPVTCRLVEDNPVHALAEVAAEVGASMIVIGARGLSPLKGLVLGSTSSQLPQLARCPVTIVPGD